MARRSFRYSSVLAVVATFGIGCAEGATESGNAPPLDGADTSATIEDTSSGDGSGEGGDDTGADTGGGGDTGGGDGTVGDGGCDPSKGLTISCGVGECTVTMPACSDAGVPNTCKPKDPGTEVCNGKDDDCDGTNDNGIADIKCGSGVCENTAPGCVGGAPGTCIPKDLGIETCGLGECVNFVSKCIGGVPQTCAPKPAGSESCDGKDNDCNGVIDDGPAAALCPPGTNVLTTECGGAVCKIKTCSPGWADADLNAGNGCECAESAVADACPGTDLFTYAIGVSRDQIANNPVVTRSHWYKITFVDARSNKTAHPRIKLAMEAGFTGPMPFEFTVQQTTCASGTVPSCGGGGTAVGRTDWDRYYDESTSPLAGTYGQANWIPILAGTGAAPGGQNAVVYVRVSYKAGMAATCAKYVLTVGN